MQKSIANRIHDLCAKPHTAYEMAAKLDVDINTIRVTIARLKKLKALKYGAVRDGYKTYEAKSPRKLQFAPARGRFCHLIPEVLNRKSWMSVEAVTAAVRKRAPKEKLSLQQVRGALARLEAAGEVVVNRNDYTLVVYKAA